MFVVVSFLMKIKKGILRIYIVLSIIWFCFFIYDSLIYSGGWYNNSSHYLIVTSLIPLPLYFILKWIAKGFE
jgi:hypothetical protein